PAAGEARSAAARSRRGVSREAGETRAAPASGRPRVRWPVRLVVYLLVAHVGFAALLVAALRDRPIWLFAAEPMLLVSLVAGLALVRRAAAAQELMATAVELLRERDFGSHLLPVGQEEADALVDLFNRMSDSLRDERL